MRVLEASGGGELAEITLPALPRRGSPSPDEPAGHSRGSPSADEPAALSWGSRSADEVALHRQARRPLADGGLLLLEESSRGNPKSGELEMKWGLKNGVRKR
jgi:hypothetical protein